MTDKLLNIFNQLDSSIQVFLLIFGAIGIFFIGNLVGDILFKLLSTKSG